MHDSTANHSLPSEFRLLLLQSAFTLIELLVVVAIIAVLASLLLPALSMAREKARNGACVSNLKQNGTAVQLFADDNDDLPPVYGSGSSPWSIILRNAGYLPNDYPKIKISLAGGGTEWTADNGMVNGTWLKRAPNRHSITVCPSTHIKAVFQVDDSNRPYYYDEDFNRHVGVTSYWMNEGMTMGNSANWGKSGVQIGRYRFGDVAPEAEFVGLLFDGIYRIGWAQVNVGVKVKFIARHLGHYNVLFWDQHVGVHREGPNNAYNYYPFWPRRRPVVLGEQIHPYDASKSHYTLN